MSKSELAEAFEAVDQTPAASPLLVDPARVQLNSSGFAYATWFVRCPKEMTPDDLKIPEIWSTFQSSARHQRSFRKFDHLLLTSFAEDWMAEGIVADARDSGVVLTRLKVTSLRATRYDRLLETEDFKIEWVGNGYSVVRKRDGHVMSRAESSAALAERHLRDLQPARAA